MKRNLILALSLVAVSSFVAQDVYAAPFGFHSGNQTDSVKTIPLTLHNASNTAIELKVGDNVISLDAGKAIAVSLPIGTKITANKATPTMEAGVLIGQISKDSKGVTMNIH
jgi:hypothetical protein